MYFSRVGDGHVCFFLEIFDGKGAEVSMEQLERILPYIYVVDIFVSFGILCWNRSGSLYGATRTDCSGIFVGHFCFFLEIFDGIGAEFSTEQLERIVQEYLVDIFVSVWDF